MAPNKWTLGTWKAKCHILIMDELSGGKIGMRNTWHGDFHVSRWIKKYVLRLDQKDFDGGKDRKKGERKERKNEKEVQFSTGIPMFEQREFDG